MYWEMVRSITQDCPINVVLGTHYILISCVTVQRITTAEMTTEEYQIQMKRFDEDIQKCDNVQGIDLSQKNK